ncbi:MAG: biopolymer transporter ExbD [Planctomycetes bacterium]|nr:biopolymer transporter ExbD [Planctomycetota bacterium]
MALRSPNQIKPDRPMQVNMTSMVDIVFLLIIFFVLVSQFISADNISVELPNPDSSLARAVELPERVVLNCQYVGADATGRAEVRYLLGPIAVDNVTELQARLATVKQTRPDVQVILRADRRIGYNSVREAMQAIALARIENINIAAEVGD